MGERKCIRRNGLTWQIGWDATRGREDVTFRAVAGGFLHGTNRSDKLLQDRKKPLGIAFSVVDVRRDADRVATHAHEHLLLH